MQQLHFYDSFILVMNHRVITQSHEHRERGVCLSVSVCLCVCASCDDIALHTLCAPLHVCANLTGQYAMLLLDNQNV